MATKARQSQKDGSVKQPPPFTKPQCRYESSAEVKNDKGQVFRITVTGLDEVAVQRYTAELKEVKLVIVPADDKTIQDDRKRRSTKTRSVPEPSPQDLDILIEIVDTGGIDPPYLFSFALGPELTLSSCHSYNVFDRANDGNSDLDVVVTSLRGKLTATLQGGGRSTQDTVPARPARASRQLVLRNMAFGSTGVCGARGCIYSLSEDILKQRSLP